MQSPWGCVRVLSASSICRTAVPTFTGTSQYHRYPLSVNTILHPPHQHGQLSTLPTLSTLHYSTTPLHHPQCRPQQPNTSTSPTLLVARCSASPSRRSRLRTSSPSRLLLPPRAHPPPQHHRRLSLAPSRAPPASPVSSPPNKLTSLRGSHHTKQKSPKLHTQKGTRHIC